MRRHIVCLLGLLGLLVELLVRFGGMRFLGGLFLCFYIIVRGYDTGGRGIGEREREG